MDMIYWDHYYNSIIALNLAIVIGLFTVVMIYRELRRKAYERA